MSESHLGNDPWNKGKKGIMPDPWNKNKKGLQVAWNKGTPCSEETKTKIGEANKGKISSMKNKKHSEETKIKISQSKIGSTPWNKGLQTGIIPKTAFKKGHIPIKPFIKGQKSWNKGLSNPEWQRENNPNWKGGIKIGANGYILIYKKEHPFCDSQGYFKRSRFTMEQKLGRYLKPEEVVHHINSIKNDDRIENLQLFPNHSEHMKHHAKLKKFHKLPPQSVNVAQSQSVAESTLTQSTPTPPVK